jgi:hypothetical protein
MNVKNINKQEKGVRLMAEQGKSNLTLLSGCMKLLFAYKILRDNVIAYPNLHTIK